MSKDRVKQIQTTNIVELTLLAKQDGAITELDIAKWIIKYQPQWRSNGYDAIVKELRHG